MIFLYVRRPCPECPWKRDSEPGKFPPERYQALRCTSRRPDARGGTEAQLGDPLFACHMTHEGHEHACAGWLAVEGWGHLAVRIAVLSGAVPQCQLRPGPGWPALYGSYAELAAANGAGEEDR